MKLPFMIAMAIIACSSMYAQVSNIKYPAAEYSNEIYYFSRDSGSLTRLEKATSKMETKSGMGGGSVGYKLEGGKSDVRIKAGKLYFVYYNGEAGGGGMEGDSAMNGAMSNANEAMAMMTDPSRMITLYSAIPDKMERKVTLQAFGGMKLISKARKESTLYTVSYRKVKPGYYEMSVDKPLPKGEYAFTIQSMANASGAIMLYAFGVD